MYEFEYADFEFANSFLFSMIIFLEQSLKLETCENLNKFYLQKSQKKINFN